MVYLIEISKDELQDLITMSYAGDNDLLNKYHVKKFTLKEAVKSEINSINNIGLNLKMNYFKVMFNNKPIGYFVKSGKFLLSFAISIQYRTKEILTDWWNELTKNMGKNFTCGLLSNNTRALDYMKKRGMKIIYENPEKKQINEILLTI